MTAEIAILNRQAVALATDSAVTVSDGTDRAPKIYNTINKLFTLSKHEPVGVMIYGNSDLGGLPVETAVKIFRDHLGQTAFGSLRDYAESFLEFLGTSPLLYPRDRQNRFVHSVSFHFLSRVRQDLDRQVNVHTEANNAISDEDLDNELAKLLEQHREAVERTELLTSADLEDVQAVSEAHSDVIDGVVDGFFGQVLLSNDRRALLRQLVSRAMLNVRSVVSDCGMVFAGFGTDEVFPMLVNYAVRGVVADKPHHQLCTTVDGNRNNGIFPFAQREMVSTFMEGVSPAIKETIYAYMRRISEELPGMIVDGADDELPPNQRDAIRASLTQVLQSAEKSLKQHLEAYIGNEQIKPVVDTVMSLPKSELAEMAETLVNLTSFRRRVTPDAETVGGPVDVAVISKGDGFVWIKRKHYFRPELNHQFFNNYFVSRRHSDGSQTTD